MTYPLVTRNAHIYEAIDDERARHETSRRSRTSDARPYSARSSARCVAPRSTRRKSRRGVTIRRRRSSSCAPKLIQVAAVAVAYIEALDGTAP